MKTRIIIREFNDGRKEFVCQEADKPNWKSVVSLVVGLFFLILFINNVSESTTTKTVNTIFFTAFSVTLVIYLIIPIWKTMKIITSTGPKPEEKAIFHSINHAKDFLLMRHELKILEERNDFKKQIKREYKLKYP